MCHTAVWTVSYYAARGAKCKGETLASANMKEKKSSKSSWHSWLANQM